MSLEAVNRGSQQERFLLFFPGVRWGKKNSGLCCEATVPNFDLEECLNPEKKLRRLSITSLVTTRGYELSRHWIEETQKSGSDPFVGISGAPRGNKVLSQLGELWTVPSREAGVGETGRAMETDIFVLNEP